MALQKTVLFDNVSDHMHGTVQYSLQTASSLLTYSNFEPTGGDCDILFTAIDENSSCRFDRVKDVGLTSGYWKQNSRLNTRVSK